MKRFGAALLLIFLPASAFAFSDGFKKYMTDVQERVLLKGKQFTPRDASLCWQRFDEEILSLLSEGIPSEERLNRETARQELSVFDRREEENIELGVIEARLFRLKGPSGPVWVAALFNGMGDLFSSTFHLYGERGGTYERVASLEDTAGPWDLDDLLRAMIQIQPIGSGPGKGETHFSSYHMPSFKKDQNNRFQIVWNFDGSSLKPDLWVPQVDWHVVNGHQVHGRGAVISLSR